MLKKKKYLHMFLWYNIKFQYISWGVLVSVYVCGWLCDPQTKKEIFCSLLYFYFFYCKFVTRLMRWRCVRTKEQKNHNRVCEIIVRPFLLVNLFLFFCFFLFIWVYFHVFIGWCWLFWCDGQHKCIKMCNKRKVKK